MIKTDRYLNSQKREFDLILFFKGLVFPFVVDALLLAMTNTLMMNTSGGNASSIGKEGRVCPYFGLI